MKNKLILLSTLFLSCVAFSQVGINTPNPQATMEVAASPTNLTTIDGLIAPKLTGDQLKAKDAVYTSTQIGAIVYVTEALAAEATTTKTVNVTSIGYYYFDGTAWEKFIDTFGKPTGFERLTGTPSTNFHWKLIGAPTTSYGPAGKYSVDASWNPADFSEGLSLFTYQHVLNGDAPAPTIPPMLKTDLGAKGQNSFAAGAVNSALGDVSAVFGTGNQTSGIASFSGGLWNRSSGTYSFTYGRKNIASGLGAVAMGLLNTASEDAAIALGNTNIASGDNSAAIGQANQATAQGTFALGNSNKSTATSAVTIGQSNEANGQASIAIGNSNVISGSNGIAIGYKLISKAPYGTSMGLYNTDAGTNLNRLLVFGNGTAEAARSDAFTILNDGKVGIDIDHFETAGVNPQAKLQVNGSIKVIAKTSGLCNAANEGSIQYIKPTVDTGKFQGCKQVNATTFEWQDL